MVSRGSSTNLLVTSSIGEFVLLRMMFSWVTWAFNLVEMCHELVLRRSHIMKMSPGVGSSFAHSRGGRRFCASGDGSNRVPSKLSQTSVGDLELIEEQGDRARSEDELRARVLPVRNSAKDCGVGKWEELRLTYFACNEDDSPVRRRGGCDISAVELAALEVHLISSEAVCRRLERLVECWCYIC